MLSSSKKQTEPKIRTSEEASAWIKSKAEYSDRVG